MTKNHWTKQILLKTLNKSLTEKIKGFIGLPWTDDLKKTITKLALSFVSDNNLDDTFEFAVVLEKNLSINGTIDIFRGMKIVI